MTALSETTSRLAQAIDALANGELLDLTGRVVLPAEAPEHEHACADALNAFLERIRREIAALSASISEASASTAFNAFHLKKMDHVANAQALEVQQIASAIQETSAGASQIAQACEHSRALTERLEHIARESTATIQQSIAELQRLRADVERAAQAVHAISDYSERVNGLLEIVEDISAQTNLLGINAAIEAAHAGDRGRGFSVVADEVKKLAESTRQQTREMAKLIEQVGITIEQALTSARASAGNVQQASARSADVVAALVELERIVDQSRGQVTEIAVVTEQQSSVLQTLSSNVEAAARHAAEAARLAREAGALELGEMTERSHHVLLRFKIDAPYERPRAAAAEAAEGIEHLLEAALTEGRISKRDIDEPRYRELDPSSPEDRRYLGYLFNVQRMRAPIVPPKFTNGYDRAIDRQACDLLQQIHERYPELKFLSFMDRNGFGLAMVRILREDWTGDPQYDLAHNRIKRLFDDGFGLRTARVGLANRDDVPQRATRPQFLAAGADLRRPKGPRPCEIRTYVRDTGEVLNDLSMGVYVDGEFFGAIRAGYDPRSPSGS